MPAGDYPPAAMVAADVRAELDDDPGAGRTSPTWWERLTSDRAAAVVFGVYVALAFPLILFVLGSDRWFLRDDWEFLTDRSMTDAGQLFADHYGHWTTLPIIAYRSMWKVVGINSYVPYEAMVVTVHLVACVLIRQVMRRAGVGAWIASATAAAFVLFGAGDQNITWAFQISMAGSLAFGLAALLVLDHEGGPSPRDAVGLALGLASLMCSGIGPLMIVGTTAALLLRRGWKRALLASVPLAAAYVAWHIAVDPEFSSTARPETSTIVDWVRTGIGGTFEALVGDHLVAAIILAVGTIGGVALAAVDRHREGDWRTIGLPVGLLVILPLLFASTSFRLWIFGTDFATSGRYLHIAAAVLLPSIALAADALARRKAVAGVALLVPLAIGVPTNIRLFNSSIFGPAYFDGQEIAILGAANSPLAEQVPDWVLPDPEPTNGDALTVEWLLEAKEDGLVPEAPPTSAAGEAATTIRLGVAQPPDGELEGPCEVIDGPVVIELDRGERFRLLGPAAAVLLDGDEPLSWRVALRPQGTGVYEITLPDLRFQLTSLSGSTGPLVCLP